MLIFDESCGVQFQKRYYIQQLIYCLNLPSTRNQTKFQTFSGNIVTTVELQYNCTYQTMSQQVVIKIQLPSVFATDKQVELELLGFRFDPLGRLAEVKQKERTYTRSDVGAIITILNEQNKKAIKLYDNKDWKNILRPVQPFAFELELNTKVRKISQPSIKIKSLQAKQRALYELLTLDIANLPSQKELTEMINNIASNLLSKIIKKPIVTSQQQISLIPQKIFNPHMFIKTQPKDKYLEYYTKGIYQYYHYGDQSFNDHGWGCAYRSLQTILSWFNLQNHCSLPKMPTLTEIQEMIDRINLGSDQKLKNSREWIGATEVSWVVKKLTNYDCRILHIADGKDIIQHCEVLREHFQKVGCPVMYGGGQYAYSIVGLNYAWQLGECQFLILDPHYPGQDSLDKILQKKGLAWRKPDEMFKKGIFYNFCLPLLPPTQ